MKRVFHKSLFTGNLNHNYEMFEMQIHMAEIKMDGIYFVFSKMSKVWKQIFIKVLNSFDF
mgnify:CR=1 FL=1